METWALKGSLFCDLFKIIGQPDWNEAIKSFAKIFHVLVVAILVVYIISIWIIPTIFALVLLQINIFGNLHDVNGVFLALGITGSPEENIELSRISRLVARVLP